VTLCYAQSLSQENNSYLVGVYSSAPLIGRIVDATGPRYTLVGAFMLLLVGYSAIRNIYDNGAPPSGSISAFTFWLLVICSFMTGAGGNGGLTSSVNTTAKSFPDKAVSISVVRLIIVFIPWQYRGLQLQG
jgi:MFS family permease